MLKFIFNWLPFGLRKKISCSLIIIKKNAITKVLYYLVLSPFICCATIVELVLVWVLPFSVDDFKYSMMQFLTDLCKEKKGLKLSVKRLMLFYELSTKGRERMQSFGELNPDKTFFVIRPYYFMKENELATTIGHLLIHYYRNLQHLSYGLRKGWIPVVDWENYGPFRHGEDYPINGTTNCWEYYWKQPSPYTLQEVYQSKNVVLSNRNSVNYGFIPSVFFAAPYLDYAKRLATKCPQYDRLFQFNDQTKKYIETKIIETLPQNSRILGVCVRATSYGSQPLKNHPLQPTINDLIQEIETLIDQWQMDYIYFACESNEWVDTIKKHFNNKVLVMNRLRYDYELEPGTPMEKNPLYVSGQRYQTNLDYLAEMYLLAKCTSLLASMSSGTRAAIIWNQNKFENVKILCDYAWEQRKI